MNDLRKGVMLYPARLECSYVPSHQVTQNYLDGLEAIRENRLEDAIDVLLAESVDSPCRGLALGNAGLALLRLEKFDLGYANLIEADNYFIVKGCSHPPSWVQFKRNCVESIAPSRPEEALQKFNQTVYFARNLAGKHDDFRREIELEIAHIFNSWGGTLIQLRDPKGALDCFQRARDIYRKYETNKVGLAETLTNLSLAFRCLCKKNEASLALKEALSVARSGGDKDQVSRIQIATIQLDPTLIDDDPLGILENAAKEAIDDGRYSTGYVRHCIRATVAENLKRVPEGLAACRAAQLIEHLLDPGDARPANMRLVLARLRDMSGLPATDVLNALFEGARLWWKVLRQPQLTADVQEKTKSMHDHFRLLARKLLDEGRNDEACLAFESGRALGFAIEVDPSALSNILALDPFAGSQGSVDCEGLQLIQAALGESEAIISMAILPPSFVSFVVRRDSVAAVEHPLPDKAECNRIFEEIRVISRRLHKMNGIEAVPWVIQDFARKLSGEIGASRIVSVIPNSVLHGVPWRALLRLFGVSWNQLSAKTEFGIFLTRSKQAPIQGCAIALGHGTAGSIDLNQEARDFANAFGAQGKVVERATSTDIQGALIKRGSVLISCHGSQRKDLNSGKSHLYLSLSDGDKSAAEIWPASVGAELVVLSACDSGVYDVTWGDYPVGAGPDLIRKGASFCLATRFPVDAQFAANLMKELAGHLSSGDLVQTAFSKALNRMESCGADFWNQIACFELIA